MCGPFDSLALDENLSEREWIKKLSEKFEKNHPKSVPLIKKAAISLHDILIRNKEKKERENHYNFARDSGIRYSYYYDNFSITSPTHGRDYLPYSTKKDNFIYASALVFYAVHQVGIYASSRYEFSPSDWYRSLKPYKQDYSEIIKTVEIMYFVLPLNIINDLRENGMNYYPYVKQVERVKLKKSKSLSRACHLSKNLYNHVNWLLHAMHKTTFMDDVRAEETAEEREKRLVRKEKRARDLKEIKAVFKCYDSISKIKVKGKEVSRWAVYTELSDNGFPRILNSSYCKDFIPSIVKFSRHYRALPAMTSQQIIRVVCNSWNSYFKAVAKYNKDPCGFKGRPSPPRYKARDGEFTLFFTNQQCTINDHGQLSFPYRTVIGTPQFSLSLRFLALKLLFLNCQFK